MEIFTRFSLRPEVFVILHRINSNNCL